MASNEMKERPILFSSPMVRAILEGRKTMTRRVVKPQPDLSILKESYRDLEFGFRRMPVLGPTHVPHEWGFCAKYDKPNCVPIYGYKCPYGTIGDRLWVKEAWRVGAWDDESHSIAVDYQADNFIRREWLPCDPPEMYTRLRHQSVMDAIRANAPVDKDGIFSWSPGNSPCRWRPSIYMPRWASRLTLEITDIRVERLRDITRDDAMEEGVERVDPYSITPDLPPGMPACWKDYAGKGWLASPIESFRTLWDSINAKSHPWESNPWVWVIEFRRAE